MTQHPGLLVRVRDKLRDSVANSGQALAVFDLDSTLFDIAPRTRAILREFAQLSSSTRWPAEWLAHLGQVEVKSTDWGLKTALMRSGIPASEEFFLTLRDYWIERFFHAELIPHDQPLPGAAEYTRLIKDTGARLVYLSGRHESSTLDASCEVLEQNQFARGELVFKKTKGTDDALFKADWFSQQLASMKSEASMYSVLFENEPHNIHEILQKHPGLVDIVFVESTHSGKSVISENWPKIKNFQLSPMAARGD